MKIFADYSIQKTSTRDMHLYDFILFYIDAELRIFSPTEGTNLFFKGKFQCFHNSIVTLSGRALPYAISLHNLGVTMQSAHRRAGLL